MATNNNNNNNTNSIVSFENISENYHPEKNITRPIMSKYEKIKCIGVRMEQISRGSPSLVELDGPNVNVLDIVMAELKEKKLPFVIIRTLPNGIKESWKVKDMIIVD